MGKIYERAVNPKQYDSGSINWNEDEVNLVFREFYCYYLRKYEKLWKNARVLEVGSGTGWLSDLIIHDGAKSVEGIEPSSKNFALAIKRFPEIKFHNKSFEDFKTNNKYDLIISIMAFSHIGDLSRTFKKISKILTDGGRLLVIVPDYDYFKKPPF